ncbi:nucleotide-diphosphate-sugar epimerase/NmrA family protein [Amycolatopsis mediterranei S699]|uniref:Nucleotide-diphosphate-sugar epimerase/NmrA family protein n=2 Tax=Amycolatopsis mediterranei TaxID=33910 RepID=A0A0H3CW03_AMYMU|nr:NAD(P)H-binding protein [Amycolatopsis mediterranei]ADJ42802.1 nucleotide-diphosphate-sugar epimerase/NmrA family protein [Amycolatopsis mediterranei U32]AEK39494.1 nucleotide-diphosphate-sugar epimerase/NmrA family protein [Amycolatopsis mediterranei S699]AFO74516.1 nucleotide-diphosphate-sugar epimerase/NmrA family protein [Amycolatopsis mediterranei S699]AGT81645.1 nucleotide-diphosphate-sugar epimerase/NmrA family protein [Amycolatopsis mediterranei RB]KDO09898.1 nucleoside-diphosphate 
MIFVLGATGKVGRHLVPALLDAGAPVRALTRDPARARIDPRAEVVRGDLGTSDLPALLAGADRVFVLSQGHNADREAATAQAAAQAGVTHLVKLSTTGVHFGQKDPITLAHAEAEQAVREAGPAWTILRPGTFMDNRFAWVGSIREENAVYVPDTDPPSALIHARDIAAVAALVLTTSGHEGATYELTGGEALTTEQQVAILSEAIGRPLKYVEESESAAKERLVRRYGWPAKAVDGLFALKRESAPHERVVFDTVERLLGGPPLTFAAWARENASAYHHQE